MKRIAIGLIVSLSLVVSACATSAGSGTRAGSKYGDELDQGKIIAVNRWAEMKGARVLWINLPQKTRLDDASVKPGAD